MANGHPDTNESFTLLKFSINVHIHCHNLNFTKNKTEEPQNLFLLSKAFIDSIIQPKLFSERELDDSAKYYTAEVKYVHDTLREKRKGYFEVLHRS